jgi:5-methylcytosine-specific restriction enzyme subunit McrC
MMMLAIVSIPRHENPPQRVIQLAEWSTVGPSEIPELRGTSLRDDQHARRLADSIRDWLDIREGYDGLLVTSTSWVGTVDIGVLRIVIKPKLPALPLASLLRYAYGLRDVGVFDESRAPMVADSFQDLLILLLTTEVEELQHRGLARHYVRCTERLSSPRGRILVGDLVRSGGSAEATLPCEYFERSADWLLNQTVRAGLELAAVLTIDSELRRRVKLLAHFFGDIGEAIRIDSRLLERAERGLTRLTLAYAPAMKLIRLLFDHQGPELQGTENVRRVPGFLFNMNAFFQKLLSRFLHENLVDRCIQDERQLRQLFSFAHQKNPKQRNVPSPRPDFALLQDSSVLGYLDAKYRDIWSVGIPAEWIYQLSIYALASPTRTSVLLYASMADDASDEELLIRSPGLDSPQPRASVVMRPVKMLRLTRLVAPQAYSASRGACRALASRLVALS